MPAMSNYLEIALLNHIFRSNSFSQPITIAIALCTDAVVASDTGSTIPEVSGGDYARVAVGRDDSYWDLAIGQILNVAAITYPQATANWGEVKYVAFLDDVTLGMGNLLFFGALTAPKIINTGSTFEFQAGQLTTTLE